MLDPTHSNDFRVSLRLRIMEKNSVLSFVCIAGNTKVSTVTATICTQTTCNIFSCREGSSLEGYKDVAVVLST